MSEKLSDVVTIISGGTPKTSVKEFWDGNIDWLAVADFNSSNRYVSSASKKITELGLNNSNTKMLEKGDLIISARGTVGAIAQLTKPMAFNQSCFGLRGKKNKLDTDYLYYWLKNYVDVLLNKSQGSVFNTINLSTFDDIKIELPSIADQRKISNLLTLLDDKIEINNQINQELEAMAKTLYDYWFVQFDFPDQNGKPYKSSGGKMVYNPELKREIPEGWGVDSLWNIANFYNGLAMQKYRPTVDEIGIPVLKIKELRQGYCDDNSELCSSNIKSQYIIHNGDVIFSWSGSLLVDFWCGGICGLNQHLFKVTSSNYDKWFYYAWTKYHLNRFVAIATDKATTMGHIKREDLMNAEVVLPSKKDYKKIDILLKPIVNLIIKNRIENRKLAQLRDTLLPKLMSGELDVSDIDI